MSERSSWNRIRREMFQQLQAEVRARLGREGAEIRRYRQDYEKEVGGRWRVSSRDKLLRAAAEHEVILLGDFHALRQSQKAHGRFLQGLRDSSSRPLVLGVECLRVADQKAVEAYLAGRLSEKKFLEKVKWDKHWGFPWEHYRPLFQWARQNGVPVWALNSAAHRLPARDRTAARRLLEARRRFPDHCVVAVFGDWHLAKGRLPRLLEKQLKQPVLRVFQNTEEPFFSLLRRGLDQQVDVIRYDRHRYAVQSVTPWVKWQNYLLWLDHWVDGGLGAEAVDGTDAVASLARWIAREWGVEVNETELTVYTAGDPDVWGRIQRTADRRERAWIETLIEDGRSFYLSRAGWGYLARPSVNHAASLAAQYIHDRQCGGSVLDFRMPRDFERMIWIETVAYLGSKFINPKRKSDTLSDIRLSLSSRQADDRGREALRLALSQKMSEMGRRPGRWRPRHKSSWIAAAHLLGGLSGERLYAGYRKGRMSPRLLRDLLKKPLAGGQFPVIYRELQDIIETMPVPFRSKREKL
ncbi:MAG: ChaN family lipoprotein [Bdellovibrionaceae bacterium]|nr:ChaN family lipoprotein [Pseudobdellovibrionaceae bacterium]MBX3034863.1 ChaN family lipoprotein [Pseudobdellovibrionaceae bacterium]